VKEAGGRKGGGARSTRIFPSACANWESGEIKNGSEKDPGGGKGKKGESITTKNKGSTGSAGIVAFT